MSCRNEETPVGAVIGGALGGVLLLIIIMVVVILTSRAIYKSFFESAKYNEVSIKCVYCLDYNLEDYWIHQKNLIQLFNQ